MWRFAGSATSGGYLYGDMQVMFLYKGVFYFVYLSQLGWYQHEARSILGKSSCVTIFPVDGNPLQGFWSDGFQGACPAQGLPVGYPLSQEAGETT